MLPRLSLAAGARADHEIAAALGDGATRCGISSGQSLPIAIEKHDDIAICGRLGAGPTRPPIAALAQDSRREHRPLAPRSTVRSVLPLFDDDDVVHRAGRPPRQ